MSDNSNFMQIDKFKAPNPDVITRIYTAYRRASSKAPGENTQRAEIKIKHNIAKLQVQMVNISIFTIKKKKLIYACPDVTYLIHWL